MPSRGSPVRYAVVGLGHIAQVAVLPAFAHAKSNSRLTALVSDDRTKLETLSRRYRIEHTYSYADYERCLEQVDAVFIALPNSLHPDTRFARPRPACTCSAKSRWPSPSTTVSR